MSFDINKLSVEGTASDIEQLVQAAIENGSTEEQIRKRVDEYLKNKIAEGQSEGRSEAEKQQKVQEIADSPEYQRVLANTTSIVFAVIFGKQTERSIQQIAEEAYPMSAARRAAIEKEEQASRRGQQQQPPAAPPPQDAKTPPEKPKKK